MIRPPRLSDICSCCCRRVLLRVGYLGRYRACPTCDPNLTQEPSQ